MDKLWKRKIEIYLKNSSYFLGGVKEKTLTLFHQSKNKCQTSKNNKVMKEITIIAYSNCLNSMYQTKQMVPEIWCDARSADVMLEKLQGVGFKGLKRWDIMIRYRLEDVPKKHRKKPLYNI